MRLRARVALLALIAGAAPPAPPALAEELHAGPATIDIGYAGDTATLDFAAVRQWIGDAAQAVRTYYGRFPVKRLRIRVEAGEGRGAQGGKTFAANGALIRVRVGYSSDAADFRRDWVMTHEMVHLAMPEFDERHAWLEEGLATYVEPIARVQAGQLSVQTVWGDMLRDMPKGLPTPGDQGLDLTHTWGRTYWGGALYYLLADVRIRERTANRYGLQDALRAIVANGGNVEVAWDVRHTLTIGDAATGTTVLTELYDEMRATPVSPDLAQLWQRLGVKRAGGGVAFDDAAPLAEIRKAITAPADTRR